MVIGLAKIFNQLDMQFWVAMNDILCTLYVSDVFDIDVKSLCVCV